MTRSWLALPLLFLACSSEKKAEVAPSATPTPTTPVPEAAPAPPEAVPQALLSLSGLEPTAGTADGGDIVVIRGRGFNAVVRNVKVYFGTREGAVDEVITDEEIRVATPPGTEGEAVDIRVMFEPGGELRLPGAFTYGPRSGAPLVAAAGRKRDGELDHEVAKLSDADAAALLAKLESSSLDTAVTMDRGASGATPAAEIDKVIKARAGLLKACYQKELAKKPGLQGKVVVSFTIELDGKVSSPKLSESATTLDDDEVTSCVLRQFQRMSFPARTATAKVTYPLIFSGQ